MKRRALTQHTLRCPLYDSIASLTVRSNPDGPASRRHLDVTACSLVPSPSFVPPARTAHFPGMEPPVSYICESSRAPLHSTEVACPKRCLAVMNAAESATANPIRCTSGINDGMELARQTLSPGLTRVLWLYSV